MLYRLIEDAWLNEVEGFTVVDHGHRSMTSGQVLDEYGDRIAAMVSGVMEHSRATTTQVSVHVGAPGPVPYIADVADRQAEYQAYWPTPVASRAR